ncbi:MAG: Lrp/AsnC family transcriptional regulator [Alphaproteobacteria bacterium]
MDEIDAKILDVVQTDGRTPLAQIGATVGLSTSAANERVKRLQADGLLTGIHGRVDPIKAGFGVCAIIEILLGSPADDEPFIKGVLAEPQVLECHHITGDWSYLLKVRARSTDDLQHLLADRIKGLPGVVRSRTSIALTSPKESTFLPCAPRG